MAASLPKCISGRNVALPFRVMWRHSSLVGAAWMALMTCGACGGRSDLWLTHGEDKAEARAPNPSASGGRGDTDDEMTTPAGYPAGESAQENFYFLSAPAPPDGPTFGNHADALSTYIPGIGPTTLLGGRVSEMIFYLADPPNERHSGFLLGVDISSEGGNQFVISYDPITMGTTNHGQWGSSPFGTLHSHVDAAVKLKDERLMILVWDALREMSRLWLANAAVEHDKGKLVHETPGVRLRYHGVDAAFRAVLSDGHNLLLIDEWGEIDFVASPDNELLTVLLSPFGPGVLTVGQTDSRRTMRVYDDGWLQGSVRGSFEIDSVAWLSSSSLVYGLGDEVVAWNAYDGSEPRIVTDAWEGRRPSGVSVPFGSGAAIGAVLGEGSSIVFLDGISTHFCGSSTAKIRVLKSYVWEGVAGVLFDEVAPNDDTRFGGIYFCAPNQSPLPLLQERGLIGKLLVQ